MRICAKTTSLILLLISYSDLSSDGPLEKLSDAPYNPALFALVSSYSVSTQYSETDSFQETGFMFSRKTRNAGCFSFMLKGKSFKEDTKQEQQMESGIIWSYNLRTLLFGVSMKPAITSFNNEDEKKSISASSDIGLCMPVFDENLICLSVSDIAYTDYFIRSRSLQIEYWGKIISGMNFLGGITSDSDNIEGNVYFEMNLKPGKVIRKFPDFMCTSIGIEKGINRNSSKTFNIAIEFYTKGYYAGLKNANSTDNKSSISGYIGIDF
ncbi:MAG: hypothetical protein JXA60_04825 [Candidatus Coatesbacteria bacterium]|nr:hypothetical protein [Candidatus Coatesbacteria bacterium]